MTVQAPKIGEPVIITDLATPIVTFNILAVVLYQIEHDAWYVSVDNRDNIREAKIWIRYNKYALAGRPQWRIYDINSALEAK